MPDDGWLTAGKKLQFKVILLGILLAASIYTGISLLNGFQYANQLIAKHPIPVVIYTTLLIAAIPFYRKNDELIQQAIHQIGWSGAVLLIPALASFLYYSYNPPLTGVGRITLTFSKMLIWITSGMVITTIFYTQKGHSED
jgi:hypothetical protein